MAEEGESVAPAGPTADAAVFIRILGTIYALCAGYCVCGAGFACRAGMTKTRPEATLALKGKVTSRDGDHHSHVTSGSAEEAMLK